MVRAKECLSDVSLVGAMDDMTERMMGCLLALSSVYEKDYKTAMMKV